MSNMFETALEKTIERLQLAAKSIPPVSGGRAGGNGHFALSEVNGAISCLNNTLDWLATGPWYENQHQHLFDLRQIQAQAANGPLSRLDTASALAKLIERIEHSLAKAPKLVDLTAAQSAAMYYAIKRTVEETHKAQGRTPCLYDVDQLVRNVALTVHCHTHPAKDASTDTRAEGAAAAPQAPEEPALSGAAILAKARAASPTLAFLEYMANQMGPTKGQAKASEHADTVSSALWADWELLAKAANFGAGRHWLKFTLTPEGEAELKAIPESELYLDPTTKPTYAELVNAIDQTVRNIKVAQGDGTEAPLLIHLENLLGIESTYLAKLGAS